MTELPKGMFCSVLIHGTALGLFLLMSERMSVLGSNRRDLDLILAQTPTPVRDKAPGPTDVSNMAHPPAPDEKLPLDPEKQPPPPVPPVPEGKAPPPVESATQTSPTGPEILKTAPRKTETPDERSARIRKGLVKTPANRRPLPVPPISPPSVARRISAGDVETRIRSRVQNVQASMNTGGGGGVPGAGQPGAADARGDQFLAALSAALHDAWNQPSRAEVGRGNPKVGVSITLRSDGTVTAFQITRPSGHAAMDSSVERLLRELRKLPPPAAFGITGAVKTIEVAFELDPTGNA